MASQPGFPWGQAAGLPGVDVCCQERHSTPRENFPSSVWACPFSDFLPSAEVAASALAYQNSCHVPVSVWYYLAKYVHTYFSPRCFPCSSQRYYLLLFVTFLLNLFVLITFSVPEDRRNDSMKSEHPYTYHMWVFYPLLCYSHSATWPDSAGAIKPDVQLYFRRYLLFILGSFHLLMSLWMVVEYFVVNYPNFHFPLPSFFYTIFERWGVAR